MLAEPSSSQSVSSISSDYQLLVPDLIDHRDYQLIVSDLIVDAFQHLLLNQGTADSPREGLQTDNICRHTFVFEDRTQKTDNFGFDCKRMKEVLLIGIGKYDLQALVISFIYCFHALSPFGRPSRSRFGEST